MISGEVSSVLRNEVQKIARVLLARVVALHESQEKRIAVLLVKALGTHCESNAQAASQEDPSSVSGMAQSSAKVRERVATGAHMPTLGETSEKQEKCEERVKTESDLSWYMAEQHSPKSETSPDWERVSSFKSKLTASSRSNYSGGTSSSRLHTPTITSVIERLPSGSRPIPTKLIEHLLVEERFAQDTLRRGTPPSSSNHTVSGCLDPPMQGAAASEKKVKSSRVASKRGLPTRYSSQTASQRPRANSWPVVPVIRAPAGNDIGQPSRYIANDFSCGIVRSLVSGFSDTSMCTTKRNRTEELVQGCREQVDMDSDALGLGVVACGPHVSGAAAPLVLRVFGLVPWFDERPRGLCAFGCGPNMWYRIVVSILTIFCIVMYVYASESCESVDNTHLRAEIETDLPLLLGSLIGVLSVGTLTRDNVFGRSDSLLTRYAQCRGLLEVWLQRSRRFLVEMFFLWMCAVSGRSYSAIMLRCDATYTAVRIFTFGFATLALMLQMHCLLHICSILVAMVDTFCMQYGDVEDVAEALRAWNLLQAAIHKVSNNASLNFVGLVTVALVAAFLPLLNWSGDFAIAPGTVVLVGVARVCICAGGVTRVCAHVPAIINSLGEDIQHERRYLLEFVSRSMAGFYVFDVRITAKNVLKLFYFCGVIYFGLVMRAVSHQEV